MWFGVVGVGCEDGGHVKLGETLCVCDFPIAQARVRPEGVRGGGWVLGKARGMWALGESGVSGWPEPRGDGAVSVILAWGLGGE